ncbi:Uncharacterised protein [Weeksella virosa]|uniref:DUF4126 domain-containing protein n=1 Tax=Weeksella virosa (strain ATCC 43766 / DSM 16922 / JCM 21250 / CCUG 30538 / CDC 9751 / IAM 14551 / NBRC 16016 / NCTC 11634 / CL345/78) TaxID=865938 RepID=F0P0K5_WEEVC|nr:DUF4126 domain-containing protein [Weeksella virosa]ADX68504.1 hypothetical protein Weevi_1814 [Weeksella virosa DSM 16922]SUP54838.1 Uncharacterised protein [Weeksella virosa]VEH63839.1 Uncharacterised protein [Weeksella virosa]
MMISTLLSLFLGVGLAAASGFRVFLPLFVLSVAAYLGADYLPLSEQWKWVGSIPAMITLGIAMIVEILAYYIPVVDNFLDTISVPLATLAGILVVAVNLGEMNELATWSLAIIAGGGTAAAISSSTATVRAISTTATAGAGNFLVNSGETASSAVLSLLAIFWAPFAFILTILVLIFFWVVWRKIKKTSSRKVQ